MNELKIIYEKTCDLFTALAEGISGQEYLKKPELLSNSQIDNAFVAINYYTLVTKEQLYKLVSREVLVDAPVIRKGMELLEEIKFIEQKAHQLKNATLLRKQAVYLYIITLQSSVLLNKAKLMLELEEKSIERGVKVITPRQVLIKHQSSFVQK